MAKLIKGRYHPETNLYDMYIDLDDRVSYRILADNRIEFRFAKVITDAELPSALSCLRYICEFTSFEVSTESVLEYGGIFNITFIRVRDQIIEPSWKL
jgi:hypothetical protein